jgi:hypothetical protein
MYFPEKDGRWQGVAVSPIRRKASRRRVYFVISLVVCLVIYRALLSSANVERRHKDTEAFQTLPKVSRKASHAREIYSRNFVTEKAQYAIENVLPTTPAHDEVREEAHASPEHEEDPPEKVESQHELPESSRSVTDTPTDTQKLLSDSPPDPISDNVTPDEPDDGEEPSLKGIAVAPKGKEPPSSVDILSETLQKPTIKGSFGKSAETASEHRKRTSFPTYDEFVALDSLADTLPDVVHIPFEESTFDVTLEGWEDKWFSEGVFDNAQRGNLTEPKIDFIYTWVNGSQKSFQGRRSAGVMTPYFECILNSLPGPI